MASSFEPTSMTVNPAISSLASVNGPSITVELPSEKETRAPGELACSSSPERIMPASTGSSLYFPMAASSSSLGRAPRSVSSSALRMIMNRTVVSLPVL
jgi:hypothetical protein